MTAGKKILEHLESDTTVNDHSVEEQMRENLTDFEKNVIECVNRGIKEFSGDFYVVVLTKNETVFNKKIHTNNGIENAPLVLRMYFFPRQSCPTPEFDQIVYLYHSAVHDIELLWSIPDKETAYEIKDNALDIPKEEHELRDMVIDFFDNTLLKKCQFLNGELDSAKGTQ